jgi:hypothetical protein
LVIDAPPSDTGGVQERTALLPFTAACVPRTAEGAPIPLSDAPAVGLVASPSASTTTAPVSSLVVLKVIEIVCMASSYAVCGVHPGAYIGW